MKQRTATDAWIQVLTKRQFYGSLLALSDCPPDPSYDDDDPYTIEQMMVDFEDDESCLEFIWEHRMTTIDPEYAWCETCGGHMVFRRYETKQERRSWTCTSCGHHVHPTADTIYHKSATPLALWFYVIYIMTARKFRMSAKDIERELAVTYKTAWRIRSLITEKWRASRHMV